MKHDTTHDGVHLSHCYQGEYEDSCKYGEKRCPAKAQRYFVSQNEQRQQLAKKLKAEHLPNESDEFAAIIFSKAWDYGHANGVDEVAIYYIDLSIMALSASQVHLKEMRSSLGVA